MGLDFKRELALEYLPIGLRYQSSFPDHAQGFKAGGAGCIMPLILNAAKGRTVAFDESRIGWPCSGFYLGFRDTIFPGIEYYLSNGPIARECERFVGSPELVKLYLDDVQHRPLATGVAVFEPLETCPDGVIPELVIFFANPDQMSALVFLAQFENPMTDQCVVTRFASACGAVSALPLRYARRGEHKAFWGMQDISARARLPKDLMTLAMPLEMARTMHANMSQSFLRTTQWSKLVQRGQAVPSEAEPRKQ
jgi:hypothetical protein